MEQKIKRVKRVLEHEGSILDFYSDYIELGTSVAAPLSVVSTLPGNPTMTADVSLISCVGIEFYQKVGANYYIFSVGNSLKIKNIF